MTNTGVNRLFNALLSGEELTAKQISHRFNLANPRDAVYTLRQDGYAINLVERFDTKGRKTQKYALSTPTRSVSTYTVRGVA